MCFYAYILSTETKIIIRWADIVELDKTNSLLFPDSIHIVTRDGKEVSKNINVNTCKSYFSYLIFIFLQHYFSMFLHKSETYSLMEQLTNLAMKRYAFNYYFKSCHK